MKSYIKILACIGVILSVSYLLDIRAREIMTISYPHKQHAGSLKRVSATEAKSEENHLAVSAVHNTSSCTIKSSDEREFDFNIIDIKKLLPSSEKEIVWYLITPHPKATNQTKVGVSSTLVNNCKK